MHLEAVGGKPIQHYTYNILKGDLAIKADGAVYKYVTRCAPVEVIPRSHSNCTEEISVLNNKTEIFVDPHVSKLPSALQ
jgi:hypothetical protein